MHYLIHTLDLACYDFLTILLQVGSPMMVWTEVDFSWIFFPIPYAIAMFTVTCSEYLLILLSLYRYLAFCQPGVAEDFCTRRKIIIYIFCINIFCILTVVPHLFAMTWETTSNGFKVVLTDFACSKSFQQGYLLGFTVFYRWIVPSILLVTTNFKVYRKVNLIFSSLKV